MLHAQQIQHRYRFWLFVDNNNNISKPLPHTKHGCNLTSATTILKMPIVISRCSTYMTISRTKYPYHECCDAKKRKLEAAKTKQQSEVRSRGSCFNCYCCIVFQYNLYIARYQYKLFIVCNNISGSCSYCSH